MKQREIHLTEEQQFQVFLDHGLTCEESRKLSDLTNYMTFRMLDQLYEAIKVIRRGRK